MSLKVLAACALLATMAAAGCGNGESSPANALVQEAYRGPLQPLPLAQYPASRSPDIVRAVYEFAARRPDVLRYMPCFCGCERSAGHGDNHDCFVKGRDGSGKPVWDSHGAG